MSKPTALILFCGVGGSSLGIQQSGFSTYSIEIDKDAADIHRNNLGECQQADILDIDPMHIKYTIGTPELIWLSPPCQAHSKAGMGKTKTRTDGEILSELMQKSELGCYLPSNDWFHVLRSPYVVLENVPEYRKAQCFRQWCCHMTKLGYKLTYEILDSSDFGLATKRKRLFVIATLRELPKVLLSPKQVGWYKVIGHLISGMTDSELTLSQCEYLSNNSVISDKPYLIERSGYYNGKPKIAKADEQLWTIRKSIGSDNKGANRSKFINVVLPDGSVKDLSVQALGMLQGFPEDYQWGSVSASVAGIGNSVCPGVAKAIATGIMQVINKKSLSTTVNFQFNGRGEPLPYLLKD